MDWLTKEFREDISKYNYIQLAKWIGACRFVVSRPRYIESQKTQEEYLADVEGFSREWEEHYRQNEEVYKSDKFKKALIYLQFRKRVSFIFDYGTGKENKPIIEYENLTSSIFKRKAIEEEFKKVWNSYYEDIEDIFVSDFDKPIERLSIDKTTKQPIRKTYKQKIADIISAQAFCGIEVHVRALKNRQKLIASSFDDFVKTCEDEQEYEIKVEVRQKKRSYNAILDELGVTSTIYHQWQNAYECEKDFDKKFFVNMCFALTLPLSMAEQLLGYNGYSIRNSKRQFDMICEKALRIGFSQEMTIALIDKLNYDRANGPMGKSYIPVPNLTKNRYFSKKPHI